MNDGAGEADKVTVNNFKRLTVTLNNITYGYTFHFKSNCQSQTHTIYFTALIRYSLY